MRVVRHCRARRAGSLESLNGWAALKPFSSLLVPQASDRDDYKATGEVVRRLTENIYIQVAFHVAGGLGLGLLIAPLLRREASVAFGLLLLSAAVLGHWYAVFLDNRAKRS